MANIACSSVQVSDDGQNTQDSLVSGIFQENLSLWQLICCYAVFRRLSMLSPGMCDCVREAGYFGTFCKNTRWAISEAELLLTYCTITIVSISLLDTRRRNLRYISKTQQ